MKNWIEVPTLDGGMQMINLEHVGRIWVEDKEICFSCMENVYSTPYHRKIMELIRRITDPTLAYLPE